MIGSRSKSVRCGNVLSLCFHVFLEGAAGDHNRCVQDKATIETLTTSLANWDKVYDYLNKMVPARLENSQGQSATPACLN